MVHMLPDYPKTKEKVSQALMDRFQEEQNKALGIISTRNKIRVFEGRKMIVIREDGTKNKIEFKQIEVGMDMDLRKVENYTLQDILQIFVQAAHEMAKQKSQMFMQTMDKSSEEANTTVDAKGKPLTPELLFETLGKMWIDFDENEKPYLPTIIVGTKLFEDFQKLFVQLESNPEYKKKFDKLIEEKRMQWRERESNRKLVG